MKKSSRIKIEVEISKRFFCLYALLNLIGYDPEREEVNVIRKRTRKYLEKHREELADFKKIVEDNNLGREYYFPLRTWVLYHGQPPQFNQINSSWKECIKSEMGKLLENKLKYLWEKTALGKYWNKINGYYIQKRAKIIKNANIAVKKSITYLRINNVGINKFVVIPNYLEEYHRGLGPKVEKTSYAMLGPQFIGEPFPVQTIQHEFLHSIINPLTKTIFFNEITGKELSKMREYIIRAILLRSNREDRLYYTTRTKRLEKIGFPKIRKIIVWLEEFEKDKIDFSQYLKKNKAFWSQILM